MSSRKKRPSRSQNRPDKDPPQRKNQIAAQARPQIRLPQPRMVWLMLPALILATLLAYQPAWHGGLLWDDNAHITSPTLQSAHGLWRIWFDLGATQQYYPVVHSAFWLLHCLWGDDTLGYHIVNILLHALSALLFALILRYLSVPGAWLAAVIFALHPVHVESVAWITELKNTLSGSLYLAAALAYLHFDSNRRRHLYAVALTLFTFALFSKTVTATLPAALLVLFWWLRGHINLRRDVLPLTPFFALGAAGGLLSAWVEHNLIGAQGAEFSFSFVERILIAGRAVWFYLGKLCWPANLIFIYPRWHISQSTLSLYLYPVAAAALLASLWLLRNRSRAPLAALLLFGGALFPVLGFFNVFPFRFSFVADHFQYLASLPVIAFAGAVLSRLAERWSLPAKPAAAILILALGGPLAFLTWNQSRQYADAETLYRTTIDRNPSCWMAHSNLGMLELNSSLDEAVAHFKEALRLKPDLAEAHTNLGNALQRMGRLKEAVAEYREAVRLKPDLAEAHNDLGNALPKLGQIKEGEAECREALRIDPDYPDAYYNLGIILQAMGKPEAAAQFQEALRLRPDSPEAHNSLGITLQSMGRLEDAVVQHQEALRLKPDFAEAHSNLGTALQRVGRIEEAISEYQEALRLKPELAEAHNSLGYALQVTGHAAEAEAQFREALRLRPGYPEACYNLAITLQGKGRLEEALALYREVLKSNPNDSAVHNNMGAALEGLGRISEAAAQYREALRLKPDSEEARTNLERTLARRRIS
jgi:Flp pilus assembly protein TadD